MKSILPIALSVIATQAMAQGVPADLMTAKDALLCVSPFKLEEAGRAIADDAWLRELLCVRAAAGAPVKRIDFSPTPETSRPWQVRVTLPDGAGVTLWGYHWSFVTKDGETIIDLYREQMRQRKP